MSTVPSLKLTQAAPEVACQLIGSILIRDFSDGTSVGGVIVETEAYAAHEAASHSHGRRTERNAPMFMRAGTIYIYRSYGIHLCMNIVVGHEDGQAVLIRALQPTMGLERMRALRGVEADQMLCSGPGRVGQALGIELHWSGKHLSELPVRLVAKANNGRIESRQRIGISRAQELPWRFVLAGSAYLSRP